MSSFQEQTKKLSSQDARLPVRTQLDPFGGSKDPPVVPGALPVAGQEPVTCFARMTLARPLHESLLHQVIVPAHGCCWDNAVVVGCPSYDQRIELRNDPRLWRCLQLLQPSLNGSQVTLARFLAGADNGLHPLQVFPSIVGTELAPVLVPGLAPSPVPDAGLAPVLVPSLIPGCFLYWFLANAEPQEIKADLSLIGHQSMRDACLVSMEM